MVMPTRHRESITEQAQGKLVITVHPHQCLLIYPLPDWEQTERKLMALPSLHPQAMRLQRLMVGHASDVELDGHGRFLIPPELREFARLERQVMLVGQGNRFELWNESRWMDERNSWVSSTDAATDLTLLNSSLL